MGSGQLYQLVETVGSSVANAADVHDLLFSVG